MKRRGFLGIMGGAVVAGPGAAKQAVTAASRASTGGVAKMATGFHNPTAGYGMPGNGENVDYLKKRKIDLMRRLKGEFTEEERELKRLADETVLLAFEIETSGMGSMSEVAKIRRMRRRQQAHQEQLALSYDRLDLSRVIRELAGLS